MAYSFLKRKQSLKAESLPLEIQIKFNSVNLINKKLIVQTAMKANSQV